METQKMADPLLNIEIEMTTYQEVEQKILFLPTMLSSRFDLTPTVKKCIKYIYQYDAMDLHASTDPITERLALPRAHSISCATLRILASSQVTGSYRQSASATCVSEEKLRLRTLAAIKNTGIDPFDGLRAIRSTRHDARGRVFGAGVYMAGFVVVAAMGVS